MMLAVHGCAQPAQPSTHAIPSSVQTKIDPKEQQIALEQEYLRELSAAIPVADQALRDAKLVVDEESFKPEYNGIINDYTVTINGDYNIYPEGTYFPRVFSISMTKGEKNFTISYNQRDIACGDIRLGYIFSRDDIVPSSAPCYTLILESNGQHIIKKYRTEALKQGIHKREISGFSGDIDACQSGFLGDVPIIDTIDPVNGGFRSYLRESYNVHTMLASYDGKTVQETYTVTENNCIYERTLFPEEKQLAVLLEQTARIDALSPLVALCEWPSMSSSPQSCDYERSLFPKEVRGSKHCDFGLWKENRHEEQCEKLYTTNKIEIKDTF